MPTLAIATATDNDPVDALIKSIRIPPRPSLLLDLQKELAKPEPSTRKIARIISTDVGMSGALLKLANSPFYGLRRKATSIEQAIAVLGMNQCIALMTGFLAKQALDKDGLGKLDSFWDESAQRAKAMVYLAYKMRVCPPDIAHTFGLFCNIGVPLLMGRFPDYGETYALAAVSADRFTAVEDARHTTNHAAIGCLLARNWGLSEDVSWAILLHHDHAVIDDKATAEGVRTLVSLSLLAENAMYVYKGHAEAAEWTKGGERARRHLGLTSEEVQEFVEKLQEMFESDH